MTTTDSLENHDARAPFDDGLQPERTALAWRRTGLALLAGSLGATRVLPDVLPIWTVVPAGLGTVVSLGVLIAAHLRYRRVHASLASSADVPAHGGALPAVVAGLSLAGAIGALLATLIAF